MRLYPILQSLAILRTNVSQGNESIELGQHVFIDRGRTLVDERDADAAVPAFDDQGFHRGEGLAHLAHDALRHELVRLLDEDVARRVIDV